MPDTLVPDLPMVLNMAPQTISFPRVQGCAFGLREFSDAVYWAALVDDQAKVDVGTLVEKLIASNLELARSDSQKPKVHALVWVNLAFLITVIFFCGVLYNRVGNLESSMQKVQSTEGISAQLQDLRDSVQRMESRFDHYLDSPQKGQH